MSNKIITAEFMRKLSAKYHSDTKFYLDAVLGQAIFAAEYGKTTVRANLFSNLTTPPAKQAEIEGIIVEELHSRGFLIGARYWHGSNRVLDLTW